MYLALEKVVLLLKMLCVMNVLSTTCINSILLNEVLLSLFDKTNVQNNLNNYSLARPFAIAIYTRVLSAI